MAYFKTVGSQILLDCYAMELYLPYDYNDKAYRGMNFYEVAGTKVRYFCVGNMRFFNNEKEMENPYSVKVQTIGVPMIVTSVPSEIDVRDISFKKGGIRRKSIVLTFYKGNIVIDNTSLIKTNSNIMMLLTRIESGKLDHVLPDEAVQILQDCQSMNSTKLRIPSEEEELMVAERYRNPNDVMQKARMTEVKSPDDVVSLTMRQEAMTTTTYQAITHEDINASLISSINRHKAGIIDEPTTMERIVRNMPLDDLIAERDARENKK